MCQSVYNMGYNMGYNMVYNMVYNMGYKDHVFRKLPHYHRAFDRLLHVAAASTALAIVV